MYIQQKNTMGLTKRDNMGFAIPPWLIIFLVMLGGGFAVCCGFAMFRFYYDYEEDNKFSRKPDQDAYMREVRERNWNDMSKRTGGRHLYPPPHQSMAHAPISPRYVASGVAQVAQVSD
jgi:hypothetical protein